MAFQRGYTVHLMHRMMQRMKLPYHDAGRRILNNTARFKSTIPIGNRSTDKFSSDFFGRLQEFMLRERVLPFRNFISGKPIAFNFSNICGHGAFLFLAVSYQETEFVRLRLFACSGIVLNILFQYYRPIPLWIPIKWNALFLLINVGMLSQLYRDKSLAQGMKQEEKEIFADVFRPSGMKDVEYLKLLTIAKRLEIKKGENIISPERDNNSLYLIISGDMDIIRDQKVVNRLETNQFCGEMSYLQWNNEVRKLTAGGDEVDPNKVHVRGLADVVASKDLVLYQWDFMDLYELFERDPKFASAMERVLSQDLNNKLKTTWAIENEARYKQLLLGVLADGVITSDERITLEHFRVEQHISNEQHDKLLRELDWSPEDFNGGQKFHSSDKLATYRDMIIAHLKGKPEVSQEVREALLRYRLKNDISAYHHVNSLEAVGWSLDEYEIGYILERRRASRRNAAKAGGGGAVRDEDEDYTREKPSDFDIWKYQPPLLRMALKYFASSKTGGNAASASTSTGAAARGNEEGGGPSEVADGRS